MASIMTVSDEAYALLVLENRWEHYLTTGSSVRRNMMQCEEEGEMEEI
jgi:hypothetical protein